VADVSADFVTTIAEAYRASGPVIDLGRGVLDGEVHGDAVVQVPLSMMNRHGLIAGATGTGKTKTLQGLAEQLSAAGTSVFVADVKGDISGLAAPGEAGGGGGEAIGKFLSSRQGKKLQSDVVRGVFGMLKKRL
jgi:hypothetical protein